MKYLLFSLNISIEYMILCDPKINEASDNRLKLFIHAWLPDVLSDYASKELEK